jgi:very-short-patch-repair endonuclease/predicted transcriptional regulator of viral defense system
VELFDRAAQQHGAVSLDQLRAAGVSQQRRRTMIANGTLVPHLPGVFLVGGSPPSWRRSLSAATLWLPGAWASHRSAAALHGLEGFDRAPIEIVVERWSRSRRATGILVHESKDLRAGDLTTVDGIACCSLVRTLVDLPAVVSELRAGIALDHAARRRPGLLAAVEQRHLEVARRGRNGTVALRTLLAERGAGPITVDSGFERRMRRLIDQGGLPAPVGQHQVRNGSFTCYLDLAWPELKVAVECDSLRHHADERAFRWDRRRRRELELQGWTVLEFTYRELTQEPGLVLRQIAAALDQARIARSGVHRSW